MVVSIVTSHDWDGLQAEGDCKEPEAMKNLIQRTKKMWPIREHFWVSRRYRNQLNRKQKVVLKTKGYFFWFSQRMRALAMQELMKNLIQRLQKKRPNREFFQRSRIVKLKNNLIKGSHYLTVFFKFI